MECDNESNRVLQHREGTDEATLLRVRDQKDQLKEYAMKVEKKLQSRRHSKLKMEVNNDKILNLSLLD